MEQKLKLYTDLASWWPLLSDPADYAEEAEYAHQLLSEINPGYRTMLELGSGGGNTASHLKAHYQMTLIDLSPGMLAVSRQLNPDCEHLEGDMRTARLSRQFDTVMIHDAIMYMLTEDDLHRALETAFLHTRPGGAAVFIPDCTRETFTSETECGGHDGKERSLRYLMWSDDPDPSDTTTITDYAYLLKEGDKVWAEHDRHLEGLFPRATWIRLLHQVGFRDPKIITDPWEREVFVARR